ncbi:hypothetical protein [Azospirillum sp. B4]|uniref:hypothetical protein n=1 Tax=Azospirillum sp. B4 TaxID=95605 RepID=UPI00034CDF75|nr:hypothetical protein [Azospirillum sp. B4]
MSISSIGGYASSIAASYRPTPAADTAPTQAAAPQTASLDRDGDGDVDTGPVDKDRGNNINIKA